VYRSRRILIVVPARGGSKGVPLKNIHPLNGIPLIAHTAQVVRDLGCCDRCVVSTDSDEIAAVAGEHGLAAPFRRPEHLSGDRIGDLDVLRHALSTMGELDRCRYDVVVMLQPTSPLRRVRHVEEALKTLVDCGLDAVWTVSPTDPKYHPRKQLRLDAQGGLSYYELDGGAVVARQQLDPLYHRNGAAYAFDSTYLADATDPLGNNNRAIVIDEPMISIDTLQDFKDVEYLLARRDG